MGHDSKRRHADCSLSGPWHHAAGELVQLAFLITVCLSFITLADPNTAALATLCVHGQEIDAEPPKTLKIILGVAISAVAYLLVVSGGMNAVKGLLNIGGLIMTVPTLWLFLMNVKLCSPFLLQRAIALRRLPKQTKWLALTDRISAKGQGLDVVIKNLLYADY